MGIFSMFNPILTLYYGLVVKIKFHWYSRKKRKRKKLASVFLKERLNNKGIKENTVDKIVENYLKFGSIADFDEFFAASIQPIAAAALRFYLVKHYLFVDVLLTTKQFVSDLGGEEVQAYLDVNEIENILADIRSMKEFKEEVRNIFATALEFRNSQVSHERTLILRQAKAYIDEDLSNHDLKMSMVAKKFNISSSHFSTVFRQEFGITFRDYLSNIRIDHAKELLRTTNISISEIAYQSGYNDSHYFSSVFKKKTGITPREFRARS